MIFYLAAEVAVATAGDVGGTDATGDASDVVRRAGPGQGSVKRGCEDREKEGQHDLAHEYADGL
jgi:hypothetical protein